MCETGIFNNPKRNASIILSCSASSLEVNVFMHPQGDKAFIEISEIPGVIEAGWRPPVSSPIPGEAVLVE